MLTFFRPHDHQPHAVPRLVLRRRHRLSRRGTASTAAPCWRRRSTSTATSACASCRRSSSTSSGSSTRSSRTSSEIGEIQHPAVRARARVDEGRRAASRSTTTATCPARSGLGSSSAFTVGLINAMHALDGPSRLEGGARQRSDPRRAVRAAGAGRLAGPDLGRLRRLQPHRVPPDGAYSVSPMILPRERLEALQDHLMLFFTGISRTAADIAQTVVDNLKSRAGELQAHAADGRPRRSPSCASPRTDLAEFGRLLHERGSSSGRCRTGSRTRRSTASTTTARAPGALGGKLLGAGGGGFMLLFVTPEDRAARRGGAGELIRVPFQFETSGQPHRAVSAGRAVSDDARHARR